MLIKFLSHGTGSAAEAAEYLLREGDYLGTEREEIEVLRGDPHEVAAVADSLEFEHRYKSGVIAWAEEDEPTRAQIERTLEEFEKTAWAGMEPDQYAWSAVLHREKGGGAHVHVLAANCELEHGRAHNIAAPGWQRLYDPLRDALNHEHGWARPDDPERIRLVRPLGHEALREAAERRAGKEPKKSDRRELGEYLIERAAAGEVRNRKDVVEALEKLGLEVTRQGKDYVSVQDEASGKRMRLKGGIYDKGFDAEKLVRADRGAEGGGGSDPGEPPEGTAAEDEERIRERGERVQKLWEQVESIRQGRGRAHQKRYRRRPKSPAIGFRKETVVESDDRGSVGGRGGAGIGGPDQLPGSGHPAEDRDAAGTGGTDRAAERDAATAAGRHVGHRSAPDGQRPVRGAAGRDDRGSDLDRGRQACRQAIERVREVYDGVREAAGRGAAGLGRAVRSGTEAAGRASRELTEVGRGVAEAARQLQQLHGGIRGGLQGARGGLQADRGRLAQGLVQQLPKLQKVARALGVDSQSQSTSGGGDRGWSPEDEDEEERRRKRGIVTYER